MAVRQHYHRTVPTTVIVADVLPGSRMTYAIRLVHAWFAPAVLHLRLPGCPSLPYIPARQRRLPATCLPRLLYRSRGHPRAAFVWPLRRRGAIIPLLTSSRRQRGLDGSLQVGPDVLGSG